ncbi:hypothetical protein CEXT_556101 [Caerostris extrusa]|uniref:Cuticle protein 10.9-like n=2 Tax=Caerostris TaxID=172845 RepID=A0AAV4RLM7_CAEEX|nr:hypothetical protein CEXT_556101 [Caerostris extrusa]
MPEEKAEGSVYIKRRRSPLGTHIRQSCRSSNFPNSLLHNSTMKVFIVLSVLVAVAVAQYADPLAQPTPYTFSHASNTEDGGSSSHQESGNGAGQVTGSYSVTNLEGHSRVVDYVADEAGFRATVRTNEPGTANLNSADVSMESTGDDNGIAAAYAGASPYAAAPAPYAAPVAPINTGRTQAGVRYVLVPTTDPRARGYY